MSDRVHKLLFMTSINAQLMSLWSKFNTAWFSFGKMEQSRL